jgi:hypothetical protein
MLAANNQDGYRNDDVLIQNNTFRSSSKYAIMIWPSRQPGSAQRGIIVKNNYTYSEILIYPYRPKYSSNFTVSDNIEKGQDQKFADLARYDFRLTESSPLINKGVTSDAAKIDFHGNKRKLGEKCAVGAYEYFNYNVVDMGVNRH